MRETVKKYDDKLNLTLSKIKQLAQRETNQTAKAYLEVFLKGAFEAQEIARRKVEYEE